MRKGIPDDEEFYKALTSIFKFEEFACVFQEKKSLFSRYLSENFRFEASAGGYYRTEEIFASLPQETKDSIKTDYITLEGASRLANVEGKTPREIAERIILVAKLSASIKENVEKLKVWLKDNFTGSFTFGNSRLKYEENGSWVLNSDTMKILADTPEFASIKDITDIPNWKKAAKQIIIKNHFLTNFPDESELGLLFPSTVITFLKKGKDAPAGDFANTVYNNFFKDSFKATEA